MTGFGALELLARAGFLVKGVVYIVVGALALQVAAHLGGRVTGTRGAFTTVLAQPFGRTLLLVAPLGFSATPRSASSRVSSIQTASGTAGATSHSV